METLPQTFARTVAAHGDDVALRWKDGDAYREWTWNDYADRVGHFAAALRALGEIVHDVDCKDEKFGRAEAAGIASLIGGLVLAFPDDAERLERGAAVFEGLYVYISSGARARPAD